ncbi:MAG: phosphoglucosamine mutase, partial [Deltaproteobacteria bacterium]|nr:phosphoglucosamine mutase [Deltaproteobacteria bacterium]
ASCLRIYPQILLNVKVREKKDLSALPSVVNAIKAVEERLKNRGRAFIRYSGTEPLARITIEGERKDEITTMANELAEVLKKEIG